MDTASIVAEGCNVFHSFACKDWQRSTLANTLPSKVVDACVDGILCLVLTFILLMCAFYSEASFEFEIPLAIDSI